MRIVFLVLLCVQLAASKPCPILALRRWDTVLKFLSDFGTSHQRDFQEAAAQIGTYFRDDATLWTKQIGEHDGDTMVEYLTNDPKVLTIESVTVLQINNVKLPLVRLDVGDQGSLTRPDSISFNLNVVRAILKSMLECPKTLSTRSLVEFSIKDSSEIEWHEVGLMFHFRSEEIKIAHLKETYADSFYQMVSENQQNCKRIMERCSGENRVYANETECMEVFDSIPTIDTSEHCEQNTGNSTMCRHLHVYLTKNSPEVHCEHVSVNSSVCRSELCEAAPEWVDG